MPEPAPRQVADRAEVIAELRHWFQHHAQRPGQQDVYERVRAKALDLALLIESVAPSSRERSLAFTKLREVVMWANAAVACAPESGDAG